MPIVTCQNPICREFFNADACKLNIGQDKYCSRRCYNIVRWGSAEQRFWQCLIRCEHEQWCLYCCWLWIGTKNKKGYGILSVDGTPCLAHRYAWKLLHGYSIPDTLAGAHYCHTPACCNAAHIHPATTQENNAESYNAGRYVSGERNGSSKLTEHDITEILALRKQGLSQREIAEKYSVHQTTIHYLLRGRNWGHVLQQSLTS